MSVERLVRDSFLIGLCIIFAQSVKLPNYLKPCSLSDPKLDDCCLEHGRQALPILVKGDEDYNIPNLSPFFLREINIGASKTLHISMHNISAYGLEKTNLKEIRFDIKNRKVSVKLMVDNLQLIGKYNMNGTILVLPIKGNGDINITTIGGLYHYSFAYNLEEKDQGKTHISIKDNDKLEFELKNAILKLDNLFDGNELLGKTMNEFLNENWREVLGEIGDSLSHTVKTVAKDIMSGYFNKVSYEEMFIK